MSNLSIFESRKNHRNFRFNFNKINDIESNFSYITKEKYEEIHLELKKIKPFYDSKDREFVRVKEKSRRIRLGIDDTYNFSTHFTDKDVRTIRKISGFESLDEIVDYPFSFNYDNFFTLTNRLDVFSNVAKIQMNESYIDSLKGFKSNSIGNSSSAFGENILIKNTYDKKENSIYHYEDDIISSFIYSDKDKIVVDKILKNINPINGAISYNVLYKKKNIISSEVRYFAYKEKTIKPFIDKSHNTNTFDISTNNRYIFTDNDINNKILSNRNKNNAIKETVLHCSNGSDYDLSISNGKNSLLFSESID